MRYFKEFSDHFTSSSINNLLTNHRSREDIVEFCNQVMADNGQPAKSKDGHSGGSVSVLYADDVWLNLPKADADNPNQPDDTKFLFRRPHGEPDYSRWFLSQHLSICHDLIFKHKGESILILTRRNILPFGVRISEFYQKLRTCLPSDMRFNFSNNVKLKTAHSSKGQEADVVIILHAVNGEFPLIHPDGDLFRIFGQSFEDVIAEERRLFYVASSRARRCLYLLAEHGEISDFVP